MRITAKRGWTIQQFESLPENEQLELFGWDAYQQDALREWQRSLAAAQVTSAETETLILFAKLGIL